MHLKFYMNRSLFPYLYFNRAFNGNHTFLLGAIPVVMLDVGYIMLTSIAHQKDSRESALIASMTIQ